MPFDFLLNLSGLFFIKMGLIVFCLIAILILLVVFRQINSMNDLIRQGKSSNAVKAFAVLSILIALGLLLTALVIL